MIQYNRAGIGDAEQIKPRVTVKHKSAASQNFASLFRLFIVIMVFVVIVLTIAK